MAHCCVDVEIEKFTLVGNCSLEWNLMIKAIPTRSLHTNRDIFFRKKKKLFFFLQRARIFFFFFVISRILDAQNINVFVHLTRIHSNLSGQRSAECIFSYCCCFCRDINRKPSNSSYWRALFTTRFDYQLVEFGCTVCVLKNVNALLNMILMQFKWNWNLFIVSNLCIAYWIKKLYSITSFRGGRSIHLKFELMFFFSSLLKIQSQMHFRMFSTNHSTRWNYIK